MQKINSSLEKTLSFMVYGSLVILVLGLLTSISILSLSHILMIVPALYFLPKANYSKFPRSSWGLLVLILVIICSIVFNQDVVLNGYKNIGKVKYFIFGFISIAPLAWYFKEYMTEKKVSLLIYIFCIATTVATIAGIVGMKTGYNYISMREVLMHRNAGLFGMLMNYAYNLSFFLILLFGLLIYKKSIQRFININFLYCIFVINLVGLYMTYTRGAWLGFLAALPFFLLKFGKKGFVGAIVTFILFGGIIYKIAGDRVIRPQSDNERMGQWQAAVKAFKERPILGYGYLNFEKHSEEIKKRYNLSGLTGGGHAHGNVFEIMGSTGTLGCIAFLSWLLFWMFEMYKDDTVVARIILPFIIVFIVGGLTQSTIALGINLFFIFAVYAVTQGIRLGGIDKKFARIED